MHNVNPSLAKISTIPNFPEFAKTAAPLFTTTERAAAEPALAGYYGIAPILVIHTIVDQLIDDRWVCKG